MTSDQLKIYAGNLYHPQNKGIELYIIQQHLNKIIVCFDDEDLTAEKLKKLSCLVINAIAIMTDDNRSLESEKFFLYLISCPRKDIKIYLQPILDYFHMIGYLKFKKNIYNDNKQKIIRYRVEFKNKEGKLLIIKKYSSLGQLSDDIGKKMTSLHYQLFKTNV
jgi:hypothetical protein